MTKPFLSFCIPTYNMASFIPELLKSIEDEVENFPDYHFEVCVSDNCSTDNTFTFFEEYNNSCKNLSIVYIKNENNLGADRNFLNVVSVSNGKYCWLLGADDRLKKNSLEFVLSNLVKGEGDIYLGDRENVNFYGEFISNEFWSNKKIEIDKCNLFEYINGLKSIGGIFSYISCILFNKASWDESIVSLDIDCFLGGNYIHVLILLNIISKSNNKMIYLHELIVQSRKGNDSFLEKGYLNRIRIDYGYIDIFDYLFANDIKLLVSVRRLLKRERNILHFLKSSYLSGKHETYEFMKSESLIARYIIKVFPAWLTLMLLNFYHKDGQ